MRTLPDNFLLRLEETARLYCVQRLRYVSCG
jgi:hypothetical protein